MIRCRIAACYEDGPWVLYLFNDSDEPLESVVLAEVTHMWGDQSWSVARNEATAEIIRNLAPGEHAVIWADQSELEVKVSVRVKQRERQVDLDFWFPTLKGEGRSDLRPIRGLDKKGLEEIAEA